LPKIEIWRCRSVLHRGQWRHGKLQQGRQRRPADVLESKGELAEWADKALLAAERKRKK